MRGADLAENSLARGTMVIKPYGYAIWEAIRDALDKRFKETGAPEPVLPDVHPAALLEREKEHVEGFAPEVAVVTQAGGEELAEPLVVRPTSETIIWETYAKWIQSYRDLPLLYNQWANVVRWELRPRLFLRTTEFLWQEGHTAHETKEEAWAEALQMLEVYRQVAEDVMAMPVHLGRKTASRAVPRRRGDAPDRGADARSQGAASRDVALPRAELRSGLRRAVPRSRRRAALAEATSWGVTTRLVGGLVMAHGDERGLRLPAGVAPDPGGGRPDLPQRRRAGPRCWARPSGSLRAGERRASASRSTIAMTSGRGTSSPTGSFAGSRSAWRSARETSMRHR